MKIMNMLLVFLLTFCAGSGFSQGAFTLQNPPFGNGIIKVNFYVSPPGKPQLKEPVGLPKESLFKSIHYFIKGGKILQDNRSNNSQEALVSGDNLTTKIKTSIVSMKYLIDWNAGNVFTYYWAKKNSLAIAKSRLQDFTYDSFYPIFKRNNKVVTYQLVRTDSVMLAGCKCFQGIMRNADGIDTKFYYTYDLKNLISPLNCFLGGRLPFNVMAINFSINYNQPNNSVVPVSSMFVVEQMSEKDLSDNLFQLTDGVPINENVSFDQLFQYIQP